MISLSIDDKSALQLGVPLRRVIHEMPWLIRPLVETTTAVDRLRAWLAAGGLDRPKQTTAQIAKALAFYGDEEMLAPVVSAIESMSPPAAEYVIRNVAIFGVGWSSHGWIDSAPRELKARSAVIILNGSPRNPKTLRRLMLHEGAHAWLERKDLGDAATAWGLQALREVGEKEGWMKNVEQRKDVVEERAEMLAANWSER